MITTIHLFERPAGGLMEVRLVTPLDPQILRLEARLLDVAGYPLLDDDDPYAWFRLRGEDWQELHAAKTGITWTLQLEHAQLTGRGDHPYCEEWKRAIRDGIY